MDTTDKLDIDWKSVELEEAVNWNNVSETDKLFWDRLIANFWVPEKISLTGDLTSWSNMTEEEQNATSKVLAGLTLLDSIQGKVGAISLIPDARTQHEVAVLTNIAFMEEIHAKSYSSIFSTLLSTTEINDLFRWTREDEFLKKKAAIILHYYRGDNPLKRKIASTLLESFLFYSGFFMPLYWASKSKLTNTADIIKLIIRDESLHGVYIGMKFRDAFNEETPERQKELTDFTDKLLHDLLINEYKYTESIYDSLGLTEQVKTFLRYNANKALQNLGFESKFNADETAVMASIIASLNTGDENHDFFSGAGSSYLLGASKTEETSDDDWDF